MDSKDELVEAIDVEGSGEPMVEKGIGMQVGFTERLLLLGRDFDSLL